MVIINKKQVNILDKERLECTGVVFIIDFSSDLKAYVDYTKSFDTLRTTLSRLIGQGRSDSGKMLPSVAQAFRDSDIISVTVVATGLTHPDDRIALKYETIEKYATYMPHGHNSLYIETNAYGRRLAYNLEHKLLGIEIPSYIQRAPGRPTGSRVYQYECIVGNSLNPVTTWRLVKEWPSLSSIQKEHRDFNLGNISSACKDISRTAYRCKWSRIKYEKPFTVWDREVIEV